MTKPLILLTNDDGINSPGLAAAASALDQQTSMGHSRKAYGAGDGTLKEVLVTYQDQSWIGYGIEASPARVKHFSKKGFYSGTDTDAYALAQGWVSVTPISIDLTSRAPMNDIAALFNIQTIKDGK